jgi:hypothetical protein
MFFISGDTLWESPDEPRYYLRALELIRAGCPDALVSMHLTPQADLPDQFVDVVDFYMFQSGHSVDHPDRPWRLAEKFASSRIRRPVINSEPCYEGHGRGVARARQVRGQWTRSEVRAAAWQSLLSGAKAGVTYGGHGVWSFHTREKRFLNDHKYVPMDWWEALRLPGAWDYGYARWLFETFGLAEFSRACRARVDEYAERITRQSMRMGHWMQWYHDDGHPASYYTLDDNNIEHIWHFLKACDARNWLYRGYRSMPWCWRCGTSLSQHELVDSYQEQTDPSCFFRCRVGGREDEYFLVWTTTPWTLTANTALALHPEAEYAKASLDGEHYYLMKTLVETVLPPEAEVVETVKGEDLIGLPFHGPLEDLPAQQEVNRTTVAWDMVSDDEGTGIVHIAPGCGAEDYQLGQELGLAIIVPIDENGYFTDEIGPLAETHVRESAERVKQELESRGVLFRWETTRTVIPSAGDARPPWSFAWPTSGSFPRTRSGNR